MDTEELELIFRAKAPILETMRSICSAVPVHHLATIHGKIDAAKVDANFVVVPKPLSREKPAIIAQKIGEVKKKKAGASVVAWRNR